MELKNANGGRNVAKKSSSLASAVRETADKMRDKKKKKGKHASIGVAPHRHCAVCNVPIRLDADPPVCDDEKCIEKRKRMEKSKQRLTIMLYLFPAIAISLVIIQAIAATTAA